MAFALVLFKNFGSLCGCVSVWLWVRASKAEQREVTTVQGWTSTVKLYNLSFSPGLQVQIGKKRPCRETGSGWGQHVFSWLLLQCQEGCAGGVVQQPRNLCAPETIQGDIHIHIDTSTSTYT